MFFFRTYFRYCGAARMLSHIKEHVVDAFDRVTRCCHCGVQFASLQDYFHHLPRHVEEAIFKCTRCDETFPLDNSLKKHLIDCQRDGGEIPIRLACNTTNNISTSFNWQITFATSVGGRQPSTRDYNTTKSWGTRRIPSSTRGIVSIVTHFSPTAKTLASTTKWSTVVPCHSCARRALKVSSGQLTWKNTGTLETLLLHNFCYAKLRYFYV